jgi:lysozyme
MDEAAKAVEKHVIVPLTDNQYAALVSFVFNMGETNFRNSTLLRRLNAKDYAAVPAELAKWNKVTVDGQKVPSMGLTKRRKAEAELWLKK